MTKVYVAIEQAEYEPTTILGVYSTQEAAQARCEQEQAVNIDDDRVIYEVRSFELDK